MAEQANPSDLIEESGQCIEGKLPPKSCGRIARSIPRPRKHVGRKRFIRCMDSYRHSRNALFKGDSCAGTPLRETILSSGMRFIIRPFQTLGGEVGIDLRGDEVRVAEQFLHAP